MRTKLRLRISSNAMIGIMAALLGLIAGAVLMALSGNNPFAGYAYLFKGGLMSVKRIGNSLAKATPLIFTGLSVAFAFNTGLFNIGASGQMLFGGFCATAIGLTLSLPKPLLLPVMLAAAMIGGGFWAFIPGLLKAKFNVHEVVSTIMMNWIGYWVIYYAVPAYFKAEYLETESETISSGASLRVGWLKELFDGSVINLGIFLALIAVIVISVILNKTVLGFELKAAGFNKHASEYAGMKVNRNIILSMVISGILAGIGGMALYTGYAVNIQIGVLPSEGFDGIAVALLGANTPLGVLTSAIFFGLLHTGKGFMNANTEIPPQIGDTIIATIIYFAATNALIKRYMDKLKPKAAILGKKIIKLLSKKGKDNSGEAKA